jgi:hypothetical protein
VWLLLLYLGGLLLALIAINVLLVRTIRAGKSVKRQDDHHRLRR